MMKIMSKFPVYASGNCDFVTKRTKLDEGDTVVMFDVQATALPVGNLCLHSSTIKMIIDKLGWEIMTPEIKEELETLRDDNTIANIKLDALRQAMKLIDMEPAS